MGCVRARTCVGSSSSHATPTGYATGKRERARHPSLIHGGARLGQSRVQFASPWRMKMHALLHDFFVSTLQLSLPWLFLAVAALYLVIFVLFAALWWAAWQADPRCLSTSDDSGRTFATAFVFAIATTQTIGERVWGVEGTEGWRRVERQQKKSTTPPTPPTGYGNTAPNDCPLAIPLLLINVLVAVVTEAVVIGLVFARISHPQHRARTVAISEVATIARRDGVLKFCFRVCDMQVSGWKKRGKLVVLCLFESFFARLF